MVFKLLVTKTVPVLSFILKQFAGKQPYRVSTANYDVLLIAAFLIVAALTLSYLLHHQFRKNRISAKNFKSIIENIQDVYYRRDLNDRLLIVSPSGAELLGYDSVDEMLNKNIDDIFKTDEEERRRFKAELDKHGKVYQYELNIRKKDGSIITVKTNTQFYYDKKGNRIGVEGIFTDITAQKQTEAVLLRQLQALQQSIDGICMVDLDGTIQFVNKAWAEMHGYTVQEVLGANIRIFHTEAQHQDDVLPFNDQVLKKGGYKGEVGHRRKDGSTFPAHMSVTLLRQANGEPTGFVGIARDITEEKRARESLFRAKQIAEEATKAKSQFLANMSHEIRTPLNAIIGMNELLLETQLDEEQRDYTKTVQLSAETLLSVVNDILDFSKVEAGKLSIETLDFSMRAMVDSVLQMLQPKAKDKGLKLMLDYDNEIPDSLRGDPTRLQQILINLVNNAIKFTEAGWVRLSVHKMSGQLSEKVSVRFAVRDTGIGVSPEKQQTIFHSFSQADNSITRKFGGTGLGLSICQQLVQLMGGKLEVQSPSPVFGMGPAKAPPSNIGGQGAVFWFTLDFEPAAAEESPIQHREFSQPVTVVNEGAATAPSRRQATRILLAEDNEFNQKYMVKLLTKNGFDVDVAKNGRKAIDLYRSRHFDIILMDMQMPEMDGLEATRIIRTDEEETAGHIPIIALTANAMAADRDTCLKAGMDDYVSKPIRAKELLAVIDAVIAEPHRA